MDQHQIVRTWHEVPVGLLNGRTKIGRVAKLAEQNSWDVRAAKTVVKTIKKNGNEKVEDFFWLGGAKPDFDEPSRVFLFNNFYSSIDMVPCTFDELKDFILV